MSRWAVVLVVAWLTASARADEPVLHVRARLRIDVEAVERVPGGLVVRGRLRDDASDEPIGGRALALAVAGEHGSFRSTLPATADGSFRWRLSLPLGSYRLHVSAAGDDDYGAAAPIDRVVDVARRTPTLTLQAPARLPAAAGALHLVVAGQEADTEGMSHPLDQLPVGLFVDGVRRGELRLVGGRGELDLAGPFGRPGQRIAVAARFAGDEMRNSAESSRTLVLTTASRLTLTADRSQAAPRDLVTLRGLASDDGGPIAGAAVAIGVEGGPDLASSVTDAGGRFVAVVRGQALGPPGDVFLEARLRPRDDWRAPALSPTVALALVAAPPVGGWPYLVSPALSLLAAALWLSTRDRPWRGWRARRRVVQRAQAEPPEPGLTESRPRLFSTLRAPADHGLTGIVVDAVDDRPLAIASVVARAEGDPARVATVDEQGRFALEDLPPGAIVVDIACAGYVAERFRRTLPHRGELRGARVRLVPVRVRIFDAWRRAAARLQPTAGDAVMTPRELLHHVQSRSLLPPEPLQALTALVESAVWAAPAPSPEDLVEAERLAKLVADS